MKSTDEQRLESDIQYRYQYLAEFIGFTSEDATAIAQLHPRLQPYIPEMVQATYERLLSNTATARHFLPKQHGYEGQQTQSLEKLTHDDGQIQFRKEHLKRYLMILLGNPHDAQMVKYLDMVGKIHTPAAGNKQIHVPPVQMNALMGLLTDLIIRAIQRLPVDREIEQQSIAALNKLMWIQNDFIQRHYVGPANASSTTTTRAVSSPNSGWR